MPWLQSFAARGAWGVAWAGDPTLTAPCVRALLTGRAPDLVTSFKNFDADPVPGNLIGYLRDRGAKTAHAGDATIYQFCRPHYDPEQAFAVPDQGPTDTETDGRAVTFMLERIADGADVVTLHLTLPDHTGHMRGATGPEYHQSCATVDLQVRTVVEAFLARHPDALVLVASDHGVSPTGTHGGGRDDGSPRALRPRRARRRAGRPGRDLAVRGGADDRRPPRTARAAARGRGPRARADGPAARARGRGDGRLHPGADRRRAQPGCGGRGSDRAPPGPGDRAPHGGRAGRALPRARRRAEPHPESLLLAARDDHAPARRALARHGRPPGECGRRLASRGSVRQRVLPRREPAGASLDVPGPGRRAPARRLCGRPVRCRPRATPRRVVHPRVPRDGSRGDRRRALLLARLAHARGTARGRRARRRRRRAPRPRGARPAEAAPTPPQGGRAGATVTGARRRLRRRGPRLHAHAASVRQPDRRPADPVRLHRTRRRLGRSSSRARAARDPWPSASLLAVVGTVLFVAPRVADIRLGTIWLEVVARRDTAVARRGRAHDPGAPRGRARQTPRARRRTRVRPRRADPRRRVRRPAARVADDPDLARHQPPRDRGAAREPGPRHAGREAGRAPADDRRAEPPAHRARRRVRAVSSCSSSSPRWRRACPHRGRGSGSPGSPSRCSPSAPPCITRWAASVVLDRRRRGGLRGYGSRSHADHRVSPGRSPGRSSRRSRSSPSASR